MYRINQIKKDGLDTMVLEHKDSQTLAEIILQEGGRLNQLIVNGETIIKETSSLTYKNNYASSILFPFVNRIKNGSYSYDNIQYQLNCNEEEKNNALHGLVYNQCFNCREKIISNDKAGIIIDYNYDGTNNGFPFKFKIEAHYTLSRNALSLKIKVKNTGSQSFPFTLGWHPYFYSEKLDDCFLKFCASKKYITDNQYIISKEKNTSIPKPLNIKNTILDNAYKLTNNQISFSTPKYTINLVSSSCNNFIQLYTPPKQSCIAIEPMTGVCNSFNNGIGLKTLNVHQSYKTKWSLFIDTKKQQLT